MAQKPIHITTSGCCAPNKQYVVQGRLMNVIENKKTCCAVCETTTQVIPLADFDEVTLVEPKCQKCRICMACCRICAGCAFVAIGGAPALGMMVCLCFNRPKKSFGDIVRVMCCQCEKPILYANYSNAISEKTLTIMGVANPEECFAALKERIDQARGGPVHQTMVVQQAQPLMTG